MTSIIKLLLCCVCCITAPLCQGQPLSKKVLITGVIDAANNRPLYLIERGNATSNTENYLVLDSVLPDKQGRFSLSTIINEAKYLSVLGKQPGWMPFLAEPGQKYHLIGNYNEIWKSKEHLSLTNRLLEKIDNQARPYRRLNNQYADSIMLFQNDSLKSKHYRLLYDVNAGSHTLLLTNFIYKNKNTVAALFIFRQISDKLSNEIKKELYSRLKGKFGQHSILQKIKAELDNPTPQAFDLALLNKLEAIATRPAEAQGAQGYLLCFWATWCGPCVKSLPTIDSLYRTDPAVQIVSISYDQAARFPKDYFAKRGYTWPSLWDSKRSNGDIGIRYGIDLLPQYILCDRTGKIIIRDTDLHNVLAQLTALK